MNLNLFTERLQLRPFTLEDTPRVYELAKDPAIAETTLNIPNPYTLEIAEDWIKKHDELRESGIYPFALVLKEEHEVIGAMSIRVDQRHKRGELAYWIGKNYWGKGYATEAAQRIAEFGVTDHLLHKIWAQALTFNPASARVMQKIGMTKEGTLVDHFYKDGKFLSVDVYGRCY
ncbi:GNAT family N-acetyltransferase [Piscibacillus sp. B03]|uniref:GNAT family N-acetyltransferase n=1 Tax=Piscibacillus sp. B03 TaxID=3457430 RepID=UPI003FCDE1C6